jgi:hypothetical protein
VRGIRKKGRGRDGRKRWQMMGICVCQSGREMAITDKKVIAQRTIINN